MDVNRLSRGEQIAGAAAVLLLIDMFLNWYSANISGELSAAANKFGVDTSVNAWQSFSTTDLLIFVTVVAALVMVGMRVMARSANLPVSLPLVVAALGALTTLMVLWRIINQPGPQRLHQRRVRRVPRAAAAHRPDLRRCPAPAVAWTRCAPKPRRAVARDAGAARRAPAGATPWPGPPAHRRPPPRRRPSGRPAPPAAPDAAPDAVAAASAARRRSPRRPGRTRRRAPPAPPPGPGRRARPAGRPRSDPSPIPDAPILAAAAARASILT